MVNAVVSDDANFFVDVVAAGIEVAIIAREIAAGDRKTQFMTGFQGVTGVDWLKGDLVNLSGRHPCQQFAAAVVVTHALNVLGDVPGIAVGMQVDHLEGEVGVLCIG